MQGQGVGTLIPRIWLKPLYGKRQSRGTLGTLGVMLNLVLQDSIHICTKLRGLLCVLKTSLMEHVPAFIRHVSANCDCRAAKLQSSEGTDSMPRIIAADRGCYALAEYAEACHTFLTSTETLHHDAIIFVSLLSPNTCKPLPQLETPN